MTTEALIKQIQQVWPSGVISLDELTPTLKYERWRALVVDDDRIPRFFFAPTAEAAAAKAISAGKDKEPRP